LNKPSFLASGAGIYTIGALANSQVIDQEATKHNTASLLEKVEDYYDCCFEEDVEVELMNGLAGYLYCLLAIQTKIEGQREHFRDHTVKIVGQLLRTGL